jgi:hypothetical protein
MKAILTAQVLQVYKAPEGKTKDGQSYGGDWRATLMAAQVLQDGQEVLQPHELRLGDDDATVKPWKALLGRSATFPVDFYASRTGLGFRLAGVPVEASPSKAAA